MRGAAAEGARLEKRVQIRCGFGRTLGPDEDVAVVRADQRLEVIGALAGKPRRNKRYPGGRADTGAQLARLAFTPSCDGHWLNRGAHNSWIGLYS